MRAVLADRRLEAIAGVPAGILVGSGSAVLTGFTELMDRVLYLVVDFTDLTAAYQSPARLGGGVSVGQLSLQASSAGGNGFGARFDLVDGSSNLTRYGSGRTLGRHLAWAQTRNAMAAYDLNVDTSAALTGALTPGSGMEAAPQLVVPNPHAGMTGICAVAYRGSHDQPTRKRVLNWLAARYGLPPVS